MSKCEEFELWQKCTDKLTPQEMALLAVDFSKAIADGVPGAYIDRQQLSLREAVIIAEQYWHENPHIHQLAIGNIKRLRDEWANESGTSGASLAKLQALGIDIDLA